MFFAASSNAKRARPSPDGMKITLFRDLPSERWFSMERYADELINALGKLGAQTHPYVLPRPLPQIRGRLGAWLNLAWRLTFYPFAARRQQGDVNHILDHSYAHLIHALDPARTVITCHDLAPIAMQERGGGLSRIAWDYAFHSMRHAAQLITISEATRREVARLSGYSSQQMTTVWFGVSPEFHAPSDQAQMTSLRASVSARDRPLIVHVGSCAPRKNIEAILRALPSLRDMNPCFAQVGGQFSAAQQAIIRNLNLAAHVRQIPPVFGGPLRAWYQAADVFLFPSLYEGFGLPVLEAMASGTPVICANASSLPEVAGDAALLIDPRDPQALAEAIRAVLTDPSLKSTLIQRGLARSREFTWERTARQTLAVYERVAAGG